MSTDRLSPIIFAILNDNSNFRVLPVFVLHIWHVWHDYLTCVIVGHLCIKLTKESKGNGKKNIYKGQAAKEIKVTIKLLLV
jgi:hypothetical protein